MWCAQDIASSWPKKLQKREATAFVRAVRRWGRVEQLEAIASEVGGILDALDRAPLLALWHGLLRGCEEVRALSANAVMWRCAGGSQPVYVPACLPTAC